MSRKLMALLVAVLLLLALATYVYYRRTLAAVPVDAYALVPADAVLVVATHDHPALVRHLQETQLWDNLTAVRYLQQASGHLALADSLAGGPRRRSGGVLALLGRKLVVTSVHVTGPGTFDVLYQVPLAAVAEYRQVRSLLENLGRDARYRLALRDFEGHEVSVLTERRSEQSLTVVNYRNHLLLSTNPALVEAALRLARRPAASPVRAAFAHLDPLRVAGVDAAVWLSYRRLPQLLDVLLQPGTHAAFDQGCGLASDGLFGLKLAGGRVELQGFSAAETARDALHQRVLGQPTPAPGLAQVLPTRLALLLHLAARPAGSWPALAGRDTTAQGQALDSLRATLGTGLALAWLPAALPGGPAPRLLLAACPQPARTAAWLARLRRLAGVSPGFARVGSLTQYRAGFGAAALLGPLAQAAPGPSPGSAPGPAPGPASLAAPPDTAALATALVGHYLVLGEPAALGSYLADVAAGRTWANTPAQVALLQETLPTARLTLLADARLAWNGLLGILPEARRAGLLRNETLFKRFPQLAWQLRPAAAEAAPAGGAALPGGPASYFTQILLRRPGAAALAGPAAAAALAAGRGLRLPAPLLGTPLLLPLPGTRVPAVAVADSGGVLRLVSPDDVVLWADSLPGPAYGLAAAPGLPGRAAAGAAAGLPAVLALAGPALHWLAPATGRPAPNFPLNLPDSLRWTDLLTAPGGPGGTRLLAVGGRPAAPPDGGPDGGGTALLLLDANGRRYPGFGPKRLDFALAGRPALLLVAGRLVVLAPLQNGYVYAFDEQGGLLPGFPLSAGARLAGGLLVEPGLTLARTTFSLVNQHGELLRGTLGGDILSRRRVATWSRTAVFRLVPDQRGRTAVVVRTDGPLLDVWVPGRALPLLRQHFVTSGLRPVQLFDFGPGHRLLALSEPGPGQVFLFDGAGRAIGGPLPSAGTGIGASYDAASDTWHTVRLVGRELRRGVF